MTMLAVGALVAVTACKGADKSTADSTGAAAAPAPGADSGGMGGMAGMPGMGSASSGGSMAEQMQAHMKMMQSAGPDSLKAMLPAHRQMAANMISTFDKEMRDMKMSGDAAWTATMDSLRNDLRTMPDLSATELRARMPAHEARATRLMQMHQKMMKGMKM
ncbi:MAG: hypothetical protein ABIR92_10510 [Gemmatimonadaceae bacterium]